MVKAPLWWIPSCLGHYQHFFPEFLVTFISSEACSVHACTYSEAKKLQGYLLQTGFVWNSVIHSHCVLFMNWENCVWNTEIGMCLEMKATNLIHQGPSMIRSIPPTPQTINDTIKQCLFPSPQKVDCWSPKWAICWDLNKCGLHLCAHKCKD